MDSLPEAIRRRFRANIRRLAILQSPPRSAERDETAARLFHTLLTIWTTENRQHTEAETRDAIHQAINDHLTDRRAAQIERGEVEE